MTPLGPFPTPKKKLTRPRCCKCVCYFKDGPVIVEESSARGITDEAPPPKKAKVANHRSAWTVCSKNRGKTPSEIAACADAARKAALQADLNRPQSPTPFQHGWPTDGRNEDSELESASTGNKRKRSG